MVNQPKVDTKAVQVGQTFDEQFKAINVMLSAMGYQIVQYKEMDGSISLSGFDEADNYCEFQNLDSFTINAAYLYVQRLFSVWNGFMGKQMINALPDFTKRFQALTPEEQETFRQGMEKLSRDAFAKAQETTPELPEPQNGQPHEDELATWEGEGGNPHPSTVEGEDGE